MKLQYPNQISVRTLSSLDMLKERRPSASDRFCGEEDMREMREAVQQQSIK